MKVKEESVKAGLKLNIQKMKIMACWSILSWKIDRENMETVIDFILGGFKVTEAGVCSHEIKGHLLLGRKAMTLCNPMDCSLLCSSIHGIFQARALEWVVLFKRHSNKSLSLATA